MFRTRFISLAADRRIQLPAGGSDRADDGRVLTATGIRGAKQRPGNTALLDQLNSTLERQTGRRAVSEPPGSLLSEPWKNLVAFRTYGSSRPPSL
jgi:hypothetical protein